MQITLISCYLLKSLRTEGLTSKPNWQSVAVYAELL